MNEHALPTYVGLMGWPVAHSRSPAMHNAAFRALGLNWHYLLLPVAPDDVGDAVRGIRALRFAGCNITVPHKQAVVPFLDEMTPTAHTVGAVNTIINRDGRLIGENTDATGFLRALREAGVEPTGQCALVVGAGGAARAVVYALLQAGATVWLTNRTQARAEALAETMQAVGRGVSRVLPFEREAVQTALEAATLLVNATSVGMHPHTNVVPLPDGVRLLPHLTVNDLVYVPRQTRLLRLAAEVGARTIDGVGMLLHQGAAAFELWTGQAAPLDVMRSALEATLANG